MQRTRLVQCPDLASYEQLARENGDLIPVLGVHAGDEGLAQALAERSAPPLVSPEARDCVVARADDALPFAAALARWTGRELITADEDFEVLLTLRARSAVLVGTPEAFTFTRLARIAAVSARPHGAPTVGIVTARSLEALSRRVARMAFSRPQPARRSVRAMALTHAAPADAQSQLEGPIDALVAATHGSSIDMDLRLGVLCGRSSSAAASAYPCVHEQGCKRSPKGERLLVHVDRLDARVLFAESCNGIALAGGLFPEDSLLALGAMDGPLSAYIGTCKLVRSSQGLLACLGGALLDAGYGFGEVTSLVNRAQAELIQDTPSFVLLGDPRERLSRPAGPRRLRVAERNVSLPLSLDVDCGGFHGRALEVVLPLSPELARRASVQVELTPPLSPDENGFALLLSSGDAEASLFICMDAPRAFERVRVVGTDERAPGAMRAAVSAAWRAIETLSAVRDGIAAAASLLPAASQCIREADGLMVQAREVTALAEQAMQSSPPRVTRFNGLHVPLDTLLGAYSALSEELVSRFPGWKLSEHLAWAYNHRIAPEGPERPCGPCRVCGSPRYEVDYASPRADALRRTLIHCARCGIQSDRPATDRPVELRGPTTVTAGETARFEWVLRNDHPFTLEVSATAVFPHTSARFGCRFEPESCTVAIPPGGEVIVPRVLVATSDALPGQYVLAVLASGLMALNVAALPLRVERAGTTSRACRQPLPG